MNNFEIEHPLLHEFFAAGGQVHIYKENDYNKSKGHKNGIVFPDHNGYDEDIAQQLIAKVKTLPKNPFTYYTVDELSKKLNITYRSAVALVNAGHIGGIRASRGYKLYPPSVTAYLKRLQNKKKREWFDAKL